MRTNYSIRIFMLRRSLLDNNKNVGAADEIVLDNVTTEDELVLTADRGKGTETNLLSYREDDDWSYTG